MLHRATVTATLVVVLALAAACSSTNGSGGASPPTTTAPRSTTSAKAAAAPVVALDATHPVWHLPAARSREAVAFTGGHLLVAGGLDAADHTTDSVWSIDPASGHVSTRAPLAVPAHDSAGAVLHGHMVVVGGGASKVSDAVQGLDPPAVVGHLPRPRADLAVATIGDTAYAVGGYDGTTADPSVLATTDGVTWRSIATLPVPVRYPAVAAIGDRLIVAGGEASGQDTAAIQVVDTTSHRARLAGHLPAPTAHAVAVTLGDAVWVLGGRVSGVSSAEIVRIDPRAMTATSAGRLPAPVRDAAVAVTGEHAYLIGGTGDRALDDVVELSPARADSGSAFQGHLLIADRGNNRLLVVDADKHVLWTYPNASAPAPPGGFYFPDDAFFAERGTRILTNEEGSNTIVELAYPSGSVVFSYGHPRQRGSAPGYLAQPDDAYLLRDGRITVADAKNCRILFLDPRTSKPTGQFGTTGVCRHRPPTEIGYPNGDTPLANGDFLVSEIRGSYITEFRPDGSVAWSVHLPSVRYPSDPQQLGPDLYLVADYARPGGIVEFTREGKITYEYRPRSGDGMLDHPSLAERLPNGLIGVNDDYRHRVALIDPASGRIVWQYGETDHSGTAPGLLRIPDGFDLLVGTTTPTHPQTG